MIGHITNIIKRGVIIMDVVNYTDFRKSLAKYIDKVDTDKGPILITRQNAKPTVLMSLEEFNSYEETLHLLSSPTNAKRLRRSIADAKAGRLIEREIDAKDMPLTFDDEVDAGYYLGRKTRGRTISTGTEPVKRKSNRSVS